MNGREGSPGRTLFFIVLVDLVGFGIVLPLLPAQGAEFSSSETAIGVLVASFSLMQFLLAPWWGRLSDRIGRRPVLLVGLASSVVSYLMFALAQSFWMLLASRIIAGGLGATVNVAQAYLADITPPERRSRAMGIIGVAFGLGFIIGPAVAAATSHAGHAVPGFVAAGFCLVSLVLAWRLLPETRVQRPSVPSGAVPWRLVLAPYFVMLLSVVGFAAITVVFPLFTAEQLGMGRRETSIFFVLMGVSSALVQGWLVGRLAPRLGERTLMIVGSVLLGGGLALVPIVDMAVRPGLAWPTFYVALILLSAGTGLAWPAVAAYISRRTGEAHQGRALGVLHSVASIARVVGPVLMGLIGERSGYGVAFFWAGGLSLAAGLVAGSIRSRQ